MFEVLSGVKPWDDYSEAERLAAIKTGDTLDYARLSIDTPAEVRQLLEQCLSIDPKQRPRIDDVCDRLQSAFEKSAGALRPFPFLRLGTRGGAQTSR